MEKKISPSEPKKCIGLRLNFPTNVMERTSSNPVMRDLAARALGQIETSDLTLLRRLLKTSDPAGRVRAAARVLAITR